MSEYVYILQKYAFYECLTIIMISKEYTTIKKHFDEINKEKGYGYQITKYKCDSLIDSDFTYDDTVNWIEVGYDGKITIKIDDGDVECTNLD